MTEEWMYAQSQPSEKLVELHHFAMTKHQDGREIEFRIPGDDQSTRSVGRLCRGSVRSIRSLYPPVPKGRPGMEDLYRRRVTGPLACRWEGTLLHRPRRNINGGFDRGG